MGMTPRPDRTSLASEVFYFLREVASRGKNLPAEIAITGRCRNISRAPSVEPVLNYGRLAAPAEKKRPIGGEVKLLPLKRRFPENFERFNLIYLVSSALPPHAELLVREAKRRGIKLVWNQNGVGYPGWCGNFYPWFNRRMAWIRRQADFIFDQSEFSRISAERYLGAVSIPSETLFNPVDLQVFTHARNPPDDAEWRILAAGTSHALYRTKLAIDTLRALLRRGRKARLVIAGEFRWKNSAAEVERELEGVAGQVEILPPFSQSEAPEIYRGAHLLLHTKYKDPCPTVPIEAMACGLPVVGTRSGGMPELVPGNCGVLAPVPESWIQDHAANPEALADGVESVMAWRHEMSVAARRHAVVAFDLNKWMNRHERVFQKLLTS